MKIAVFTPYNIFQPGGVQEHVRLQVKVLRERGHDVTIITPRPRKVYANEAPEGVMFLGASARMKAPHATSADLSVSPYSDRIDEILENDYDILHVHEPLVPVTARQLLMHAEGRTVRIGTFHAALPGNPLGRTLVSTYKTYARAVMPHVDVLTAVSPAATGFISEFIDKPIHYIPNCIDLAGYKPGVVQRDPNLIFFMGRLEKRKGAMQAIRAFEVLKTRREDVRLVIASDGPLRDSLEQYVESNGIQDVTFLGVITDEQKRDLLYSCGVFTSPALYGESFGIVLAEAMACETPIVAHHNEGYRWTLPDTGRLSLVDCTDEEAYADRLQLLLEDASLREVWVNWAKEHVKQFDINAVVDSYEKIYKQYLDQIN